MKKSILYLVALVISASNVLGQPTVVTGKVDGGNGLTIRLMTYSDQVAYLRQTIASGVIDDSGCFRLEASLDEVIHAWLDIEFSQADIYLQPGMIYNVNIALEQKSLSSSYYDRLPMAISFNSDDTDQLNRYIQDFNEVYNDFILTYISGKSGSNSANSFQAFKTAVGLRFKNANNPYFLDYCRYKIASMEMFLRLKSRDKLGIEYLSGQPVLYHNIEYMEFFHLFFEKYFLTGNKFFDYNKTYQLIKSKAALEIILDSLGRDPVLQDKELRELVLLAGLKELHENGGFDRPRIQQLVEDLSVNGSSEAIRQIAANLIARFHRLQPGTPAPEFSLPAISTQKTIKLSDFKGKWVYLVFFDSRNPACQAEMRLVSEWYEEVAEKVSFVAVSVDKDLGAISGNPNILPEVWTILNFDDNLELLESYDALTFPYFVLIDREGYIKSCPALSPSENIREVLNAI